MPLEVRHYHAFPAAMFRTADHPVRREQRSAAPPGWQLHAAEEGACRTWQDQHQIWPAPDLAENTPSAGCLAAIAAVAW